MKSWARAVYRQALNEAMKNPVKHIDRERAAVSEAKKGAVCRYCGGTDPDKVALPAYLVPCQYREKVLVSRFCNHDGTISRLCHLACEIKILYSGG